ncbi:MAG: ferredoxin [Vicinamibacteria bacterium]
MSARRDLPSGYYITDQCDGCGLCAACAPENIEPAWDGSRCDVAHQPADAREQAELHDAEMACPLACLHRGSDRAMRRPKTAGRQP